MSTQGHGGSSRDSNATDRTRSSRGFWLFVVFLAVALVLVGRLVYIQIIAGPSYAAKAQTQRTRTVDLPATRGTIYDRNGKILATTVDATTVYCDPGEVTDAADEAAQVASVLGGSADDYLSALSRENSSFAYIAKKIDPDVAASLEALGLDGVHFLDDSKRVYPYDGAGSQIIGVTDTDGAGISGLELNYEDLLHGADGQITEQRGLGDIPISGGLISRQDAQDGSDIVTTIDIDLQIYIEGALAQAMTDTSATGGSITVYDGATGEIYASASAPLLNVGSEWRSSDSEAFSLKSVTGTYEPGSTFKSVTCSAVLDQGTMTPETVIDVPATLPIDDFVITDHEEHGDEALTLTQVIAQSSNIGTVLASQTISSQTLCDYIEAFGFTHDTGVDFPGAASGKVADLADWTSATAANVPFGQGITVSPLQVVRAYGAFVDGGKIVTPHFLLDVPADSSDVPEWVSSQVIKQSTVDQMIPILESVVTDGTSPQAAVTGYTVAGKSGTAQYAEGGSYVADSYITSFVGFLPDSNSDLICLITLNGTTGDVNPAAGEFSKVMTYMTEHYGIEPNG